MPALELPAPDWSTAACQNSLGCTQPRATLLSHLTNQSVLDFSSPSPSTSVYVLFASPSRHGDWKSTAKGVVSPTTAATGAG